jgi:hypothetical protein
VESFDAGVRRRLWGAKGAEDLDVHIARCRGAKAAGFSIVETNYVVGTDPYETMIGGLSALDDAEVAVVPNVVRSYTDAQLSMVHEDVWRMGFEYFLDGFKRALATYRHPTIKAFAGRCALDYLGNSAPTTIAGLPIRHT